MPRTVTPPPLDTRALDPTNDPQNKTAFALPGSYDGPEMLTAILIGVLAVLGLLLLLMLWKGGEPPK